MATALDDGLLKNFTKMLLQMATQEVHRSRNGQFSYLFLSQKI
jgi:hypothetical protein